MIHHLRLTHLWVTHTKNNIGEHHMNERNIIYHRAIFFLFRHYVYSFWFRDYCERVYFDAHLLRRLFGITFNSNAPLYVPYEILSLFYSTHFFHFFRWVFFFYTSAVMADVPIFPHLFFHFIMTLFVVRCMHVWIVHSAQLRHCLFCLCVSLLFLFLSWTPMRLYWVWIVDILCAYPCFIWCEMTNS